jgi:tetratricopeptide (TPR) repeat protein
MGVVYSAYDPQLDRRVAIKVIRSDAGAETEAGRARLLREAQAMAKLSHPNVITVYDVGTAGQAVFLAMELVEGVTLRAWSEARRRSWRAIRDACVQAGRGLSAAHAVGLVHRDYKPDNVIVDGTRARVGDFGLATALRSVEPTGSAAVGSTGMPSGGSTTRSGAWVGTPAYVSPEQLAGARPDARSDQYAFCVASYEVLCGTHPFAAPTFEALVERVEEGRVEPPVGRDVPRWLVAALIRGMQRRPGDRFSDMDALLVAMQRDLRRRAGARAVGVAALVVGTSAAAYVVGARTETVEAPCGGAADAIAPVWGDERAGEVEATFVAGRPRYGAQVARAVVGSIDAWADGWVRMHEDACEATRVRREQSEARLDLRMACLSGQRRELDALVSRFATGDPMVVDHAVTAVMALPDVEACGDVDGLGAIVALPGDRALAEELESIRAAAAEAWALLRTGRYEDGADRARALVERATATGYGPVIAEVQLLAAHAARQRGEIEPAREAALESLLAAQASGHDRVVAQAWTAQLEIAGAAGRFSSAVELGRHAAAAVARLGSPVSLEAPLRNAMGVVFDNLGRYDEAERELGRALELRRAGHDEDGPEVAAVLTNLGNLARNRRAYADALALHREALAIDQRVLGDEHPAIGRHLHNVARLLLVTGKRDEALESYQRALALEIADIGPASVAVARTHNSLGLLFAAEGDAERAMAEYEQALAIHAGHEHPERGIVLYNIGLLRAAAGDHEGALRWYGQARPIIEQGSGGSSRRYAELVLATADARLARGQRVEARAGYVEARGLVTALGDASLALRVEAGLAASESSAPDRGGSSVGRKRATPSAERGEPETPETREPPEPRELPGAYAPGPGWEP